jgi:polysaccharide export outer membrane protein
MGSGMKRFRSRLIYSAWALSFLTGGFAQLPTPASGSNAALQACEAPRDEEYKLGRGDQISVEVLGFTNLSGKHTIGPDGMITLDLAGSIKVADLTREKAAASIRDALSPYYRVTAVIVGVDVYTSDYVLVLGAVEHPGLMTFDEPPTLLSVISRAGMAPQTSATVQVKPIGVPERVAVFCDSQTILWEDFKKLLESGKSDVQMRLKRNAVVYVPSPNERYVSVFGEVLHPGVVQLQDGATLAEMLAEAGGIVTDKSGRLPKIQIIHEYTGSVETVAYQDILQSRKFTLALQTGDIIYVPESKFSRAAVTLEKISPLISIATIGTLIAHP